MTLPSFLARKTLGQPHYLLLAMACAFVLAFIPGGARRALDSSTIDAADWLPPAYNEMQDLAWFREHFPEQQFALVSWDGCTLGNAERLKLVARRLVAPTPSIADPDAMRRTGWYARVITGPEVVQQLMTSQVGLSYAAAVKRLEGALVGPPQRDAQGRTLGDETRTTGLIVYLSPAAMSDQRTMRDAVEGITTIAADCGVDPETIHMGGPPVDNARIDAEGQRTLVRLASLAGLAGVALCYWRLGSRRLTALVIAAGATSAGLSLAIVFYYGVFEVFALEQAAPDWGALDAVLMAMPAVVYLLALSGALHAVNYYFEARREGGLDGAAERTIRLAARPALLSALAAAAGIAALAVSDIVPVQKFAVFTAAALVASVAVALVLLATLLHCYPPSDAFIQARILRRAKSRLAGAAERLFGFVVDHNAMTLGCWIVALIVLSLGMARLGTSVQILKLLDQDSQLIGDYAWIERHIGNLVPVEVILTMPPERLRASGDHAEEDGQQYRLTMLDRLELIRDIERRLEEFPQISRALSAATFAPPTTQTALAGANRGGDYAKNKALETHRGELMAGDYLRMEREPGSDRPTGRELWRLSARVAAHAPDGGPVDYDVFLGQLQRAVEPVLISYQQRDRIVRALQEQGKELAGARVCVLFRAPDAAATPPPQVQEKALADLLGRSGLAPGGVSFYNIAVYERPGRGDDAQDQQYRQAAIAALRKQDAVVLASAPSDPAARRIAADGVYVVDVTGLPSIIETAGVSQIDDGGPRPIRAAFTGVAPVVAQTQRQLLASLRHGLLWAAALVAVVVTLAFMSVPAGVIAMAPSLLPLAAVFGTLGWLGVKIDLGIMMIGGVALALAVEGTIHYITWFQRCLDLGLTRRDAVLRAYDRCGTAMIETALVGGLGLTVLTFSAFTPIRQFGYLLPAMLVAALAGNLLLLPAILASPLGWFFAPLEMRRREPLWAMIQAHFVGKRRVAGDARPGATPGAPRSPHFDSPPQPARRAASSPVASAADQRQDLAEGPHAALHAKLQQLRRATRGDSPAS